MEQAKFMVLSAILLALSASPANKCQHKFQPGLYFLTLPSQKVADPWTIVIAHKLYFIFDISWKNVLLVLLIRFIAILKN